jgi:hypothetical protein
MGSSFASQDPWQFVRSSVLFLLFVAGQQYKSLEDQKVDRLVWTIRALFCAGAALMFLFALLNVIWGAGGARG